MKILFIILILASFLRLYGLNWDQGQHFHPDERMIIMVAEKITWQDLNPHFFAYGSFPIYLLKVAGSITGIIDSKFATYDSINLVGRSLSALFDLGTLIVLYFLGKKIFNQKIGLLTSFFYAISVLPIQLSHFYAVDTPLTFFILAVLYSLILYLEKPAVRHIVSAGVLFGVALATKTSAILLAVPIFLTLALHASKAWPWSLQDIKKIIIRDSLLIVSTVVIFFVFEPYAFLDFSEFWKQTLEQSQMTNSAFTFPYTLQYFDKVPYLYELKNIFFWGLGPILATFSFMGILYTAIAIIIKEDSHVASPQGYLPLRGSALLGMTSLRAKRSNLLVLLSFFGFYFFVVGHFAIGFMRYMLPLYPLLCLFAAFLIYNLGNFLKSKLANFSFHLPRAVARKLRLSSIFYLLLLIWPLSFISIYTKPNTRNTATSWIMNNIPQGSSISTEHWDDGLPIGTQSNYIVSELPMYDPDSSSLKWQKINQVLQNTEYIIIASNRLYTPLQKMTDCVNLPPGKCYNKTAQYYQDLFSGKLGFTKVAEFSDYPTIPLLNYTISDFTADESFTVYDHPKVMIYKKLIRNQK